MPAFVMLSFAAVVYDLRTMRIPYWLTLPLFALAMWIGDHQLAGVITLAVLMVGFVLLSLAGKLVYGDADAVLGGAFAALLGWPLVGVALVAGCAVALGVNRRRPGARPYPLGPYIVGSGLLFLLA